MHRATIAVAAGRPTLQPDAPLNQPVEFASALAAGGSIEYARHDARNSRSFETVLGALEGGHAVLFASGMAAVNAVLEVVGPPRGPATGGVLRNQGSTRRPWGAGGRARRNRGSAVDRDSHQP